MKNHQLVGLAVFSVFMVGNASADNSIMIERAIDQTTPNFSGKMFKVEPEEDFMSNSMIGVEIDPALLKSYSSTAEASAPEKEPEAEARPKRVSSREELEELTGEAARKAEQQAKMQNPGWQHRIISFGSWVASTVVSVCKTLKGWFTR